MRRQHTFHRTANNALKRRTVWARNITTNNAPAASDNENLLLNYQNAAGIIQFGPGMTIARIHVHLSINMALTALPNSQDGVFVALFVDQANAGSLLVANTAPYNEQFLAWGSIRVSDSTADASGSGTARLISKVFDIRSKRKINAANDTLWM